jgi:gluconate 2-dehydrogenase gamma chain
MAGSSPGAGALSRRELLKRAGVAGVVFTLPAGTALTSPAAGAMRRQSATTLTAAESTTLEAMLERLIPTDATGPGAREAQVLRFIQQALAGELKALQGLYTSGLAALDAYAAGRFGAPFAQLPADQQDAILRELEADTATGFTPSADAFFETVLEHALEGMFGDPYHGGNANFVGWDLIGFPGIKLSVPSVEQRIGTRVEPAHRSTTDYAIFRISGRR